MLVVSLLAGCGSSQDLPIARWALEGGGTVAMPVDVRDRVPVRGGTVTVHTTAQLPPELRGRDVSLAINVHWCSPQLTVNGERVDDVARSAFENQRSRGGHLYRIPAKLTADGALALRLDVVDTYAFCTAFFSVPTLAAGEFGPRSYRWVVLFNDVAPVAVVTAGSLLSLAFLVFARASRRTVFLWAAAFAFGSTGPGLNQLGFWQYFLGWRGDVPSPLLATLAAYACLRFASEYVGAPLRARLWTAASVLIALGIVATTRRYDLYPMFALVSLSALFYAVVAALTLIRHGWATRNARLLTGALLVSLTPMALELLPASGLPDFTNGAHTAALGQTLVLFAMMVAFARDFRAANADLEAQLAATEARGREVSQLNDELRRQIAARSRDLADALAGTLHAESESRVLAPGDVIDGRYVVIRTLGRGGMGVVYEVERRSDGKRLALKSMTEYSDARAAARFAHEAELVASVHHPNLVDIVDFGFARGGFLYLVMELVTGGSLEGSRDRFGDTAWARPVLAQIAAGLEALHARGVVHRDLKPANVLLDGEVAKIADFGISRRDEESDPDPVGETAAARHLTRTGAMIGTPLYMAPELAAPGVTARAASDVFSFGVLAHELFTAEYPFPAPPIAAALAGVSPAPAKRIRSANPSVDVRIADLVDACLHTDARQRPTASELVRAFAA